MRFKTVKLSKSFHLVYSKFRGIMRQDFISKLHDLTICKLVNNCWSLVSRYFQIRNLFSLFKNFPSTRSVFKSNSPIHKHPMISGFTLKKLGLLVAPPLIGLLFGKRLDTILLGHQIRKYQDSPSTCYRIHCEFVFLKSTLESGFKNIRIRFRISRMRVDVSRIRKEKVAISNLIGYLWTGP